MSRHDCDICRGSKTIRLPVYHPIADVLSGGTLAKQEWTSYRDFPCPQCSDTTDSTHVMVATALCEIDERYVGMPGVMACERRNQAMMLAEQILKAGLVRFTERRIKEKMAVEVRAEVGVVSRAFVASMEKRVAQRQWELARETIEAAGR